MRISIKRINWYGLWLLLLRCLMWLWSFVRYSQFIQRLFLLAILVWFGQVYLDQKVLGTIGMRVQGVGIILKQRQKYLQTYQNIKSYPQENFYYPDQVFKGDFYVLLSQIIKRFPQVQMKAIDEFTAPKGLVDENVEKVLLGHNKVQWRGYKVSFDATYQGAYAFLSQISAQKLPLLWSKVTVREKKYPYVSCTLSVFILNRS